MENMTEVKVKSVSASIIELCLYLGVAAGLIYALGGCALSVKFTPLGDGQEVIESTTNKTLNNTTAKESRY